MLHQAKIETKELDFDFDTSREEVTQVVRGAAADQQQAESIAKARKSEVLREGGGGSVEMDLTVQAQAEAPFMLSGARPGVDGTWRIVSVSHKASRSGGSTTSVELKQPEGGAGKDSRKVG